MSVCGLGYVGINVTNLDAWLELTTEILGMEAVYRENSSAVDLRLDDWHHRFALYPGDVDGIQYVGWDTPSVTELENLVDRLRDYGISVNEAEDSLKNERAVRELYWFDDPASGNRTELFFAPLSSDQPFKPGRGISGYRTGDLGLGHVVYMVHDYEKSKRFYTDVLGFELSDYIAWDGDKDGTFFHCGPRHHSLAIMPPFGHFQAGDFNHVMVEANSLDDVGYAYDMVRDRNIPLIMEMGKHTNDHMHSFYVQTPSGFGLEYGCHGRLIDQDWKVRSYDSPALWGHRMPES